MSQSRNTAVGAYGIKVLTACIYLYDLYSDYVLAISYAFNGDYWYCALTSIFTLLPSFIHSILTAIAFYKRDDQLGYKWLARPTIIYPLCILLQGQLAGAFMWLSYFPTFNASPDFELIELISNANSYIEVIFESLPQLCLQTYIIVVMQGYSDTIQVISIVGSVFGACFGLIICSEHGIWSKVIMFVVNLLWVVSRAVALAIIGSVKKYCCFVLPACHMVIIFLITVVERRGRDWFEIIGISAVSIHQAYVPIFHPYMWCLSIVITVENIACCLIGYFYGHVKFTGIDRINTTAIDGLTKAMSFINNNTTLLMTTPTTNSSTTRTFYVRALLKELEPFKRWEYAWVAMVISIACSIVAMVFLILRRVCYGIGRWDYYPFDEEGYRQANAQ